MLYNIIRFTKDKKNKVIKEGVTLTEAQKHCNDPRTESVNFFDGYTKQGKK